MSEERVVRDGGAGTSLWREVGAIRSRQVDLAPAALWTEAAGDDDALLYLVAGTVTLSGAAGGGLGAGTAVRVGRQTEESLTAGPEGARLLAFRCSPACDEHASLGTAQRTAKVDLDALDPATSGREFQVLFDMTNGSPRGTLFLGKVPPGAAPWHFHHYDEIVWILEGHGVYHLAQGDEELEGGCAFRVRPREVHIVENAGDQPMLLLGLFTPAGSPAAAFLARDPR